MSKVKIEIDGKPLNVLEGTTILKAAQDAEINIPTLCHRPDLTPEGLCRVCVVEVKGAPRLVASCHTPVSDGMVIHTRSPRVVTSRKTVIELLLAGHTGPCVTDECAGDCELHNLAAEQEAGAPRFRVKKPRQYAVEEISPYVKRDMGRCILCRRCIRACAQIAKKDIFSMAYRGFLSKVVVDCDIPLNKEVCKDCGICIDHCPTSALTNPKLAELKQEVA
ncbi:MAG: (2Fe-2S)-binding protein [Deltaproteobacteria bacterium]|nr:(2Fe-2S)-binding protein [Deltaproteobacteria bacterium]